MHFRFCCHLLRTFEKIDLAINGSAFFSTKSCKRKNGSILTLLPCIVIVESRQTKSKNTQARQLNAFPAHKIGKPDNSNQYQEACSLTKSSSSSSQEKDLTRTPLASFAGVVSKPSKNLLTTCTSGKDNQNQSVAHEKTQGSNRTKKYLSCRDSANVHPHKSFSEIYGEDDPDCADGQEVTVTTVIPKASFFDKHADNQEDNKDVSIIFNRNMGREFFIFLLIFNFCIRVCCVL